MSECASWPEAFAIIGAFFAVAWILVTLIKAAFNAMK